MYLLFFCIQSTIGFICLKDVRNQNGNLFSPLRCPRYEVGCKTLPEL
uniref:Uncharacterized protein n=1 Tax=Siphoviridae sp. ctXWf36 TaxID=2825544 RepID=A0A8S5U2X5_9CAUD|nr:MAG TPA: hypothetical protein [Siphoviridae sp. ctXWf36]